MKPIRRAKLQLKSEKIRNLTGSELAQVNGGRITNVWGCGSTGQDTGCDWCTVELSVDVCTEAKTCGPAM